MSAATWSAKSAGSASAATTAMVAMSNPYVYEVGSVTGMDGSVVRVGVDNDAVWIRSNGTVLNRVQAEQVGQLYLRACWLAGQQDTP
jgi:hypothetical protein